MVAPVCVTWQVSRGWVGQARHCRQGKRLGPGVAGWALAATGLAGCWLELFVGAECPWSKARRSPMAQTATVSCRHLLIKHEESRNPISRRTNQPTTMTKAAAIEELEAIAETITPQNFADLAFERSDCGSFQNGGDLGPFARGQMQAAFEEAAFALQVGQISGLVDSDSGVHLVLRYA